MNPTSAAFLLAGIQLTLIVLLSADRWVHRLTGPTSLEGRIKALEDVIPSANARLSQKMSDLQKGIGEIQLTQARQDEHLKATDRAVVTLQSYVNGRS